MTDPQEPKVTIYQSLATLKTRIGVGKAANAIRLARREAGWELRCRGYTQEYIAARLGINQSTVSRDLRWCHKTYKARLIDDVGRVQAEQIGVLEYVRQEALEAWRLSKEEAMEVARKTLQAQASTGQGSTAHSSVIKPLEQTTKIKSQTGHVPYLAEARAAMADIRKLVGAEKPTKVALTDPSGEKEAKAPMGVVIVVPSRMAMEDVMDDPVEDDPDPNPSPDSGA